jgi:hypothetical protein
MVALDGVTVAPGAFAPLTIEGDLAFTSGVLDIGVLDLAQFDRLVVTGTATLGSLTVQFDFGAGATVYAGERYEFLSAGALTLDAAHLSFQPNGLAAGLGIAVDTGAQALVLRIVELPALAMAPQARLAAAPVPLPPALWLFSCSLAGLLRRRR